MSKTAAERLLDAARASSLGEQTGVARIGSTIVTYHRIGRFYDVGTDAVCVRSHRRAVVLPYVEALLSGCVTDDECEAWIAKSRAA